MLEVECGFPQADHARASLVHIGPTISVRIGFDVNFRVQPQSRPDLPERTYPALIDTGATESCIDSELAALLELPIVDRAPMAGVDGSAQFNLHAAQITIPSLNFHIYGRFAGVHLRAGGQSHQALLGRTFLQRFKMAYNGTTGSVVIRGPD